MSKRQIASALMIVIGVAALTGAQPSAGTTLEREARTNEDFPYVIAFEEGAVRFDGGDRITITEVRGTSKDMQSGICRISGVYELASQESATLAASVTASNAEDGRGHWNSAQKTDVGKGRGEFTLMLPVSIKGWPHVSFYADGRSIGGIYVGTGDGVLQRR
jgi:hypothetical protein